MDGNYVKFTKEMKEQGYTILVPNMLPMQFKLIMRILNNYGYKTELLETFGPQISETGLKYVHNDTCYPAILVIGQFINALQSGKYDPNKVALILFQTGGGCRASNYISLLRKALEKAGYGHVPVISFSLAGIEKHPGWKLSIGMLHQMLYAVLYGDMLMTLVNQCRPYELNKGDAEALADKWVKKLTDQMAREKVQQYHHVLQNYRRIVEEFGSIPMDRSNPRTRVGIVGEIYVKYSPLGNNNLETFLGSEGAEVVVPGLLDFCLYCVYNNIMGRKMYGTDKLKYPAYKFAFNFLAKKQQHMIDIIEEHGMFDPPTPISHTISLADGYINIGTKMGEGWLLTAEMLELSDKGVKNIICTQPFGCLPNHICGKGMMKPIKEKNPDINIVAIDYDAGASQVNQINRIKLMLSNARMREEPLQEKENKREPELV